MIPQGSKGSFQPRGKTLEGFRWGGQHVLSCLFLEDHCGYCGARLGRTGRGACDGRWSRWGNGDLYRGWHRAPHRPASLQGGPSRGPALGVPPFVLRRFFCLERPWNRSCELLPMSPAFWVCHLILGSPDVSTGSREESPGEGRCRVGGFQGQSWGPESSAALAPARGTAGCPGQERRKEGHHPKARTQGRLGLEGSAVQEAQSFCLCSTVPPMLCGSRDTSVLLIKGGAAHP